MCRRRVCRTRQAGSGVSVDTRLPLAWSPHYVERRTPRGDALSESPTIGSITLAYHQSAIWGSCRELSYHWLYSMHSGCCNPTRSRQELACNGIYVSPLFLFMISHLREVQPTCFRPLGLFVALRCLGPHGDCDPITNPYIVLHRLHRYKSTPRQSIRVGVSAEISGQPSG